MPEQRARDEEGTGTSAKARKPEAMKRAPKPCDACAALTEREKTVLALLAEGMRNQEISDELGITERTVKYHVSSLLAKLGASNRTQLVLRAMALGFVDS